MRGGTVIVDIMANGRLLCSDGGAFVRVDVNEALRRWPWIVKYIGHCGPPAEGDAPMKDEKK